MEAWSGLTKKDFQLVKDQSDLWRETGIFSTRLIRRESNALGIWCRLVGNSSFVQTGQPRMLLIGTERLAEYMSLR